MNRGSLVEPPDEALQLDASMRPRFMNRGSAGRLESTHPRVCRFNEAPIHESGKLRGHGLGRYAAPRFNEAPIHESGKSRLIFAISRRPDWLQ